MGPELGVPFAQGGVVGLDKEVICIPHGRKTWVKWCSSRRANRHPALPLIRRFGETQAKQHDSQVQERRVGHRAVPQADRTTELYRQARTQNTQMRP